MYKKGCRTVTRFKGRKGWVQRVPTLTFVLVPRIYDSGHEELRVAGAACRIVYQHGLMPFYPPFFFGAFLTVEELECSSKKLLDYWLSRCSKIWIACACDSRWVPPEGLDLDTVTFNTLRGNQSSVESRPVSALISVGAMDAHPIILQPDQVDMLLMQNLQSVVAGCL